MQALYMSDKRYVQKVCNGYFGRKEILTKAERNQESKKSSQLQGVFSTKHLGFDKKYALSRPNPKGKRSLYYLISSTSLLITTTASPTNSS